MRDRGGFSTLELLSSIMLVVPLFFGVLNLLLSAHTRNILQAVVSDTARELSQMSVRPSSNSADTRIQEIVTTMLDEISMLIPAAKTGCSEQPNCLTVIGPAVDESAQTVSLGIRYQAPLLGFMSGLLGFGALPISVEATGVRAQSLQGKTDLSVHYNTPHLLKLDEDE